MPNSTGIQISARSFNNEPFIRVLTAVAVDEFARPLSCIDPQYLQWTYDDNPSIWATLPSGSAYTNQQISLVREVSTLHFYVSGITYDVLTQNYDILTQNILASYITFSPTFPPVSTVSYTLSYDTFPNIPVPVLYANFENTRYSPYFYRLTSANSYTINLSSVIDEELLSKANFLSATNTFSNSTAWVPTSVSVINKIFPGPDVGFGLTTNTADLIVPLSGMPYGVLLSANNIVNGDFLRLPGFYTVPPSGYETESDGVSAIFKIGVSLLSTVSSIEVANGGYGYTVGDTFKIKNSIFNIDSDIAKLYFSALTVQNGIHEIKQTVTLPIGYNTFSVYVYPSGNFEQFVYFKTNKHDKVIFDPFSCRAFNYGNWDIASVATTTPQDFGLTAMAIPKNSWVRCIGTLYLSAADTLDFSIGLTTDSTSVSSNIDSSNSALFWGAQIEPRSNPSSYITGPGYRNYSQAWFTLNNQFNNEYIPLSSTVLTALCSIGRSTEKTDTLQLNISAKTSINSLSSWYTPHIFSNSISVKFLNSLLTADFIGYPSLYFDTSGVQRFLDDSNYTTSPGLCFYGENHTEKIRLSATAYSNAKYIWSFNDPYTFVYDVTAIDPFTNANVSLLSSTKKDITVYVPSFIGYYPNIPITLFITNQNILSSGPTFQYNDTTGYLEPYPFYYSTSLTLSNGQTVPAYNNPQNNIFKQNIKVQSYTLPATSFKTSITDSFLLPIDETAQFFNNQFLVALFNGGPKSIDPCYDKYNVVWSWSGLSGNNILQSLTTNPSSWADTQCFLSAGSLTLTANPGRFPKKWRRQGYTTDTKPNQAEYYTGSNIFWTLSTPEWSLVNRNPYTETSFNFPLQFLQAGLSPFTTSIYKDTPVSLYASQTVTCIICASPFDWGSKDILIQETVLGTALSRGDFRFYIQNKLALTGTKVEFENLSTGFNNVSSITIDLDNNTQIILTDNNLYNNFSAIYNELGRKTITATIRYTTGDVFTETFKNVVNVLPYYDEIDTSNYRTLKTELILPWPEPPYIASNDWAVEDNINSVVKKFYENLDYLDKRGRCYFDTPLEFYGWLGQPPQGLSACPLWAWEDTECNTVCTLPINPDLIKCSPRAQDNKELVFWTDTECLDPTTRFSDITANGKYYRCATWGAQECDLNKLNPDCFGKYCVEWKWKYRKSSNLSKIIPWRYTRKGGFYEKKWFFEPCVTQSGDIVTGLNCDEGLWNVNIPKINSYYDPITLCDDGFINCSYTCVAVKDDLIFVGLNSQIKVLSSQYDPEFFAGKRTIDDYFTFQGIRSIGLDSLGKLYVLDAVLNKIASYYFDPNSATAWEPFISWGGFGTTSSNSKFNQPNDMHVDQFNNIWVADTGNKCIKHFTNSGTWIQTIVDNDFETYIPLSVVVDSNSYVHILLVGKIKVYTYKGEFLYEYPIDSIHDTSFIFKLNINYNREIIYTISNTQVGKYFRNGAFAGFVVDNKKCFDLITGCCQDSHRNVLITSGEKIGKFIDPMRLRTLKGPLPKEYWSLNDLLIHKEEYVQDWVYNKTFQRLWDNIEIFRHSLAFGTDTCNNYVPFVHDKNKIIIGQNEIVTSTVINRVISYLWDNFITLIGYFDPACIYKIEEDERQKQKSLEEVTLTTTAT